MWVCLSCLSVRSACVCVCQCQQQRRTNGQQRLLLNNSTTIANGISFIISGCLFFFYWWLLPFARIGSGVCLCVFGFHSDRDFFFFFEDFFLSMSCFLIISEITREESIDEQQKKEPINKGKREFDEESKDRFCWFRSMSSLGIKYCQRNSCIGS